MIDIHCHLLPNIDDGSQSWEESLEMARLASQDGIRVAVATPHWIQGTKWQPSADEIKTKVKELNQRIAESGINLTVLAGMEIGISENLCSLVSSDKVLTLGESPCLLIETPYVSLPYGIEGIISGLNLIKTSPILAHPERNREIQRNPKRVLEFVNAGAYVQVTAGSLCGHFGESARRCALELAKLGIIHAVATDAHSVEERPPFLSKGLKVLEEVIGKEKTKELVDGTYRLIGIGSQAEKQKLFS